MGPIHFLDIEHLSSFFRVSGLGPLGRLFQIYRQDFESETSVYLYSDGGKEREMVSKEAYKKAADRLTDVLKTDKLKEIESLLAKNINLFIGLDNSSATIKISAGLH